MDLTIAHRTTRAVAWLTLGRLMSRGLDFGLLILLGRFLTPGDFGLVALAATLVTLLEAVSDLPVAQVITRMSNPEAAHYDTAFTLSTFRAIGLSLVCASLAWPFAAFYHDVRLFALILALSVAPVMRGLMSPRLAHFSRSIDFRRDVICEIAGKCMSLAGAGVSVSLHATYWSIAAGSVAGSVAAFATSYVLAPYRPRLTLRGTSAFGRFLGWSTAAQIVNAVNWQSEKLVLGRFVSSVEIGRFSMGSDLASLPLRLFVAPLVSALLPAFSLIRADADRLRRSYLKTHRTIAALGLPLLVAFSILAKSLIMAVLGPKWIDAAWPLQVLSLSILPSMLAVAMAPLAIALDKPYLLFRRNLAELLLKLPIITLGAVYGGLQGFLFATAFNAVVMNLMSLTFVKRIVGISVTRQLLEPWRTYASMLPMSAILLLAPTLTPDAGVATYLSISACAVAAGIAYAGSSVTLWFANGRPEGLETMAVALLSPLTVRMSRVASQTS